MFRDCVVYLDRTKQELNGVVDNQHLSESDLNLQLAGRIVEFAGGRIAQSLGIDRREIPSSVPLDPELCHRMWWTLIIVEW